MRIHFIALGGSVMHGLAISLHETGHVVTGSDDKIYDPARSRLDAHNLLPEAEGWDASRITPDIEAVILGMHAFADNPELLKAKELGLPIYSFPEFIYEQSRNKQRVVIAGSYGKSTTTAMVMHVLKEMGQDFDYLVGAKVPGFENSVKLTADAPAIILEGDEYLASRIDLRPKFLLYQPHIAVINGISWDHINVFPTEAEYEQAFAQLIQALPKAGVLIYHETDKPLKKLVDEHTDDSIYLHPFKTPSYRVKNGIFRVKMGNYRQEVKVVGRHNMQNIAAAWEVCQQMAVDLDEFLAAIATFEGIAARMETVYEDANCLVIKDYAHAPAKVDATLKAVRERYPKRNLIACLELHTFSSLDREYIQQYQKTLNAADHKFVFVDHQTIKRKRMEPLSLTELQEAFAEKKLNYFTQVPELQASLKSRKNGKDVFLMMSSGNFGGLKLTELAE